MKVEAAYRPGAGWIRELSVNIKGIPARAITFEYALIMELLWVTIAVRLVSSRLRFSVSELGPSKLTSSGISEGLHTFIAEAKIEVQPEEETLGIQ